MKLWHALAAGAAGLTLGAGGFVLITLERLKTGLPNLDKLRAPLILAMAKHGVTSIAIGRAMMGIFHNEHTNGNPNHDIGWLDTSGPTNPMALGDDGHSIGPGQDYRPTVVDLISRGKISKPEWVAAAASDESWSAYGSNNANLDSLVELSLIIFLDKLSIADAHGADDRIQYAVGLYNGSGQGGTYESNELSFVNQRFTGVA